MISRKPSDIIKDFLDLMDISHDQYLNSKKTVESYDEQTISWVHKIENEDLAEERSKISTAWHKERLARRAEKNNMLLYEKIHEFSINEMNKSTLKRLRSMLGNQIKTEEYLSQENKVLKSKRRIE